MTGPATETIRIDPASRVPLHAQLADQLRALIRDGRLRPGDPLPSETELQADLGVSRSVIRQALTRLTAEGLLHRARGRGTVVTQRRPLHRLAHRAEGLAHQVSAEGHQVRTRVLSLEGAAPPPEVRDVLGEEVVRLERVRSVDGVPVAYIRTWLPAHTGRTFTTADLTDASLHHLLRERFAISASGGARHVQAVPADPDLAAHLDLAVGAALLLLSGTTTDQHGAPLEVFQTWHRGDMIAFDLEVGTPAPRLEPSRPDLDEARRLAARLGELLGPVPRA